MEATSSSKASAPSPIAEAKAAPKDAAPSAPSTLGDIVTSGAGTDAGQAPSQATTEGQTCQEATLDQSGNVIHVTHILDDVDDGDDLKKLTFLFLHRVYSVFCPDKTAKTTELIVKYEDKLRELICSVGGKYLKGCSP